MINAVRELTSTDISPCGPARRSTHSDHRAASPAAASCRQVAPTYHNCVRQIRRGSRRFRRTSPLPRCRTRRTLPVPRRTATRWRPAGRSVALEGGGVSGLEGDSVGRPTGVTTTVKDRLLRRGFPRTLPTSTRECLASL